MLACVVIPHFLLAIALRSADKPGVSSVLLLDGGDGPRRVLECSVKALKAGVRPGMKEKEARSLCPEATVLFHDADAVDTMSALVLGALEKFSPTLEFVRPGMIICDLGAFDDPAKQEKEGHAIIRAIAETITMTATVSIAEAPFVAGVAAQDGRPGAVVLVPSGGERAFLQDKSVSYLPISAESCRRLELVGILTIGQLTALPEKDLLRQFGKEAEAMLRVIDGEDKRPLDGGPVLEVVAAVSTFDGPIVGGDVLEREIQRLVGDLVSKLQQRGELCTTVQLMFSLDDGNEATMAVNLASPVSDAKRLWRVLKLRIAELKLGAPPVAASLTAGGLVGQYARQTEMTSLFDKTAQSRAVERLVDRLRARPTVKQALMQVQWDDPHSRFPERVAHLQGLIDPEQRKGLCLPIPITVATDGQGLPRGLRRDDGWLLVDTVLASWDLEDEWWTARPVARAYYRLILSNGTLMRVFLDRWNHVWYQQSA